jgi:hypothetical protein
VPSDVVVASRRADDAYIIEPAALAEISGLSLEELDSEYIDSYTIARALAARYADRKLRALDNEERDDRYRAVRDAQNTDLQWWYMEDAEKIERFALDAGRLTERRNAVGRTLAGEAAVSVRRENNQLRTEALKLRLLAERALEALEDATKTQRARREAAAIRV